MSGFRFVNLPLIRSCSIEPTTTFEMGLLQKIVKNDAMREDPPEIYGWKVYFLAFSVRHTLLNLSSRD
jgi:hypothetical protein